RMRDSNPNQQAEFDLWSTGQSSFMGPRLFNGYGGVLYAEDTFNQVSQSVSCSYPSGSTVYIAANAWYRFTMEVDPTGYQVPYRLYLDGIPLTCGTNGLHLSYAPGNIFWMLIASTSSSGPWSVWFDDIKVYANNNGVLSGYNALQIGFDGLAYHQSVQLVGDDGTVIDQTMQRL